MDHMQPLLLGAQEPDGEPSGHVLLASCPPESHLLDHPEVPYNYPTADPRRPELSTLMDLSKRLHLDGEITPVMAWAGILTNPRFAELNLGDFEALKEDLKGKVRCYGYVSEDSTARRRGREDLLTADQIRRRPRRVRGPRRAEQRARHQGRQLPGIQLGSRRPRPYIFVQVTSHFVISIVGVDLLQFWI